MSGMGSVGGVGAGMGGMGGAGGVGGAGGAGAAGAAGGASGVANAQAAQASTGTAPEPSAKITISDAAMKANSVEPTQPGASFSLSVDKGGHHYAGGTDANGFSNPDLKPMQTVGSAGKSESHAANAFDLSTNALGQKYSDLNKLDDAIAALLLAMLQKK